MDNIDSALTQLFEDRIAVKLLLMIVTFFSFTTACAVTLQLFNRARRSPKELIKNSSSSFEVILLRLSLLSLTLSYAGLVLLETSPAFLTSNRPSVLLLLTIMSTVIVYSLINSAVRRIVILLASGWPVKNPISDSAKSAPEIEREFALSFDSAKSSIAELIQKEITNASESLRLNAARLVDDSLRDRLRTDFGNDLSAAISAEVNVLAFNRTDTIKQREDISSRFDRAIERMAVQAGRAERHAKNFRSFGITFALFGLASAAMFTGWFFIKFGTSIEQIIGSLHWDFLIFRFLPNFGFIVFCELLALLMLRYHSRALAELRWYANEANTIEIKRIAALMAQYKQDRSGLNSLIKEMFKTERNFILEKGQSTVEMANNESENRTLDSLLNRISIPKLRKVSPNKEREATIRGR